MHSISQTHCNFSPYFSDFEASFLEQRYFAKKYKEFVKHFKGFTPIPKVFHPQDEGFTPCLKIVIHPFWMVSHPFANLSSDLHTTPMCQSLRNPQFSMIITHPSFRPNRRLLRILDNTTIKLSKYLRSFFAINSNKHILWIELLSHMRLLIKIFEHPQYAPLPLCLQSVR